MSPISVPAATTYPSTNFTVNTSASTVSVGGSFDVYFASVKPYGDVSATCSLYLAQQSSKAGLADRVDHLLCRGHVLKDDYVRAKGD